MTFAPELLQAGVGGILAPSEAPDLLVPTIQAIRTGQRFLSPAVATALLAMDRKTLTRAELRVVALLAEGLSTVGITHKIGIHPRSVHWRASSGVIFSTFQTFKCI